MAKNFLSPVTLQSGLIIPASAAAGKVLTSDANGNATWQTPAAGGGGANGVIKQPEAPTDTSVLWIDTDEFDTANATQVVSALPTSPLDGQEVYFQTTAMALLGQIWHLRYRNTSSSAYKWDVIAATPLRSGVAGISSTLTGSAAAIPGGPSIAAPLSGEYAYDASFAVVAGGTGFILGVYAGFNGSGLSNANAYRTSVSANGWTTVRMPFINSLTAGQSANIMVASLSGNVTPTFYEILLYLTPIRVG